jgi:DNA-binding NarL/FixJ family response regulator
MITPKSLCILVMKTDVMLKRAVISLMGLEKDLEIVVSEAVDFTELAMDVSKINPNVILFSDTHPAAAKESLTQLLTNHSRLRIVVVSVKSNWLHIFDKEDMLLTSFDDFLGIIKSDR